MSVPERCEVKEIGVDSSETPEVDSRQVMFKEVKELQAEGLNIAQISKKLDIVRQTVRKYMGCDTLPKRATKER